MFIQTVTPILLRQKLNSNSIARQLKVGTAGKIHDHKLHITIKMNAAYFEV